MAMLNSQMVLFVKGPLMFCPKKNLELSIFLDLPTLSPLASGERMRCDQCDCAEAIRKRRRRRNRRAKKIRNPQRKRSTVPHHRRLHSCFFVEWVEVYKTANGSRIRTKVRNQWAKPVLCNTERSPSSLSNQCQIFGPFKYHFGSWFDLSTYSRHPAFPDTEYLTLHTLRTLNSGTLS